MTGDIVKSTELTAVQLESVRKHVTEAARLAGKWKRGLIRGKPDFFQGDAWQLLVADPARSLRVAVFVRTHLISKSADTSVAIGIGEVEKISSHRISLSTGNAFVRSGRSLDELKAGRDMAISIAEDQTECLRWLDVVLQLCEVLIDGLSERQAELVSLALHPDRPTHETISTQVSPAVDRQVVSKTLLRAGFNAIEAAISQFEAEKWVSGTS